MTLEKFVEKYEGKPVDYDKAFGAQCVDLVRQYFQDVWELPKQPEGVIGAQDFFYKHESRKIQRELCECVPFTGMIRPPAGSVVILKGTSTNQYGHIGICTGTDKAGMYIFEQDGIANEKALAAGRPQIGAYIKHWNYDRLLGWLIKRGE